MGTEGNGAQKYVPVWLTAEQWIKVYDAIGHVYVSDDCRPVIYDAIAWAESSR